MMTLRRLMWALAGTATMAILLPQAVSAAMVTPAAAGERAVLNLQCTVTGQGNRPFPRYPGQGTTWSTRRSLEVTVELVAQKPVRESGVRATAPSGDDPVMAMAQAGQEMQQQFDACAENDTPCQMAVAMKLANSPQMQAMHKAATAQKNKPLRYQLWEVAKDSQPVVQLHLEEHWEDAILIATREVRTCSIVGPAIAAGLRGMGSGVDWEAKNREQIDVSARSLVVEIDSESGIGRLRLPAFSMFAEQRCRDNTGSQADTQVESTTVSLFPEGWFSILAWIEGTASPSGKRLADGKKDLQIEHGLGNIGMASHGGNEVRIPVQIAVNWSLEKQ